MTHKYFSQRAGTNPNPNGLPLRDICGLFEKVFDQSRGDGFFDEALGSYCVDAGQIPGKIGDIDLEILLAVRKKDLWPIADQHHLYSEGHLFDLIEFLYQHVSKRVDGTMHSYANCGMHWEVFSQEEGKKIFKDRINMLLQHYENHFELSDKGQVLKKAEAGFEPIFNADVPSTGSNVVGRINSAIIRFRRHGSNMDDRRQAVRDLVDVLEYLRPQVKEFFTSKDEGDLFNIANNFGIRHLNAKQKISYDANIWLSWMFYFYLSTIHVLLRKSGTIVAWQPNKGDCVVMIAREWKCRVPAAHSEEFTGYLYETGIKDSSATPGFLGAQIFGRFLTTRIELTLITYWENLESIKAFAGDDISQARLYPEDEVYELEPDLSVQHYEVIEHEISPELRG